MVFVSILGRFGPPVAAMASTHRIDAVFMITRGVHASRESGSRRWRRHETTSQVPDSVLLVVQSYPVSSLAHDQVMHRLRSAKWPVTLRFSRPLTDNDVTPLARCLQLEQQGELPDDLKLQMLKRLLSKGVAVKKHGSRTAWKSTLRRLRAESSRRPPRHRRGACSTAMLVHHRSTEPARVFAEK